MAVNLKVYIDTRRKKTVKSDSDPSFEPLPVVTQGEVYNLYVYFVEDSGLGIASPYSLVTLSGLSLETSIGNKNPVAAKSTPDIYQNSFSVNTTLNRFEGSLTIADSDAETLLGSNTSVKTHFSFKIIDGATEQDYIFDVVLSASVAPSSNTAPTPAIQYVTKTLGDQRYVNVVGEAGQIIILTSPDGTKQIALGCDDNGAFTSDVIT